MNKNIYLLLAAAFLSLPTTISAQAENPRGIYKMMTLLGKHGEIKAPFDQYKICTDSVTLMLNVQGTTFRVQDNDHKVLRYTGPQPRSENDKSTLIYDSNAEHFTLKWWNSDSGHLYFPDNNWCIENYEANQYSEIGRKVFDILTAAPITDRANPLLGTWRVMGDVDELRDLKKALPAMHENYEAGKYYNSFYIFTPGTFAFVFRLQDGAVNPVEYKGKGAYMLNGKTFRVKWLTKNRIAVEEHIDYRTDYKILERVCDGQSMLSRMAGHNSSRIHY